MPSNYLWLATSVYQMHYARDVTDYCIKPVEFSMPVLRKPSGVNSGTRTYAIDVSV